MKDKHLTSEEIEAFEQHEVELLADEQSIAEEVEKLGLNKMSRELLENMAAKWHLELSNAERDLNGSINLNKQIVESFLSLGAGKATGLIERARKHDGKKGGDNKAEKFDKSIAIKNIKADWKKIKNSGAKKEAFINGEIGKYRLLGIELDYRHLENTLGYKPES